MSKKENIIIWSIVCCIWCYVFYISYVAYNQNSQIENLNKQIELLECYRDNYLMMADSIQNIHAKCFKIGK